MIIVRPKPMEKILEMIAPYKNILVVACNGCVAITQHGGEKQAELIAKLLSMARKIKGNDSKIEMATVLRQCDKDMVESTLKPIINEYDCILSMACGVGVQTVADVFPPKVVLPAHDTIFMGQHDRLGPKFEERCKACGDCILHETGGICPIARCAKSLLNGPCGGFSKGKCEVGGWVNDCAWVLIFNRLKEQGRLDLFLKFRPPKDWRTSQQPRKLEGVTIG